MNEQLSKTDFSSDLQAALDTVDCILEQKGEVELADVSKQLSHAIQAVVRLRNHMADASRLDGQLPVATSLERVNGIISLMASIEYPRAGIQWPRIQKIRDHLKEVLAA